MPHREIYLALNDAREFTIALADSFFDATNDSGKSARRAKTPSHGFNNSRHRTRVKISFAKSACGVPGLIIAADANEMIDYCCLRNSHVKSHREENITIFI